NHSDARSLIRKRNQPEPAVNSPNQNCQRAVNSFRTPHTVVMRENRQLLKMLVSLLDLELFPEHRSASAGIDKVTRPDRISRAIGSHRQIDAVARELDCFNQGLLVNVRSGFGRMIEQHLVEITARHLISVIGLRTIAVLKIELRS